MAVKAGSLGRIWPGCRQCFSRTSCFGRVAVEEWRAAFHIMPQNTKSVIE